MIRPGKLSDLPDILNLTKECARDLSVRGIYQWNEKYPSEEVFMKDVERRELWVLEQDGKLAGTLVVSSHMDEEYKSVHWLTPETNHRYVHRLAIHPDHQGNGLARLLMDYAEDKSRKEGVASIRLDTFSRNLRNQKFYENRGYKRLGVVYFPHQSPHPFYCYELLLSSPGESSTHP